MRVLYLDCAMGAAGDMLTAALAGLVEGENVSGMLGALGVPGVEYDISTTQKCGISGLNVSVMVNGHEEGEEIDHHDHHDHDHHHDDEHEHGHHHHEHHGLEDIKKIVANLNVDGNVKSQIIDIYGLIAAAESKVHGEPVGHIHFHEVGAMDAVADVAAVCTLIKKLDVDKIICSPINLGSGTVRCAHGVLPVPAPATAVITQGMPVYGSEIKGELLTPTGAALIKYFATSFGPMPMMNVKAVGYGMGKKDFDRANCVRAFLGETDEKGRDEVVELNFNVDDMTAEQLAFAVEKILSSGARDAFLTPVVMKKGRCGNLVTVICDESKKQDVVALIFKYTSTIGVREKVCFRYVLDRATVIVETPCGKVRKKVSEGYGVKKQKYEYDDLAAVAEKLGVSIQEAEAYVKNYDK